jgi:hypothetical protein
MKLNWTRAVFGGLVGALNMSAVGLFVAPKMGIPGPTPLRGALFSFAPWLMAMVAVMPMMGMPMFGGAAPMAIGSLVGHIVYGVTLGSIYGQPEAGASAAQPSHA